MGYTLAIADVVELPVKFTVNSDGKPTAFTFAVRAKRMPQADLREALKQDTATADFLRQQVVGWRGQRLVMREDGEPAEFNPDSFDCMLSLVGMEALILNAYLRAMGVEAAAEKAKN